MSDVRLSIKRVVAKKKEKRERHGFTSVAVQTLLLFNGNLFSQNMVLRQFLQSLNQGGMVRNVANKQRNERGGIYASYVRSTFQYYQPDSLVNLKDN